MGDVFLSPVSGDEIRVDYFHLWDDSRGTIHADSDNENSAIVRVSHKPLARETRRVKVYFRGGPILGLPSFNDFYSLERVGARERAELEAIEKLVSEYKNH